MARRLIYAMVLLPVVPATAVTGTMATSGSFWIGDELRTYALFSATLWVALSIIVWRAMIDWTLGRAWRTALTALIPFAQVLYPQPLWQAKGCGLIEVLRTGQHHFSLGLWIWLVMWIWWGWERFAASTRPKVTDSGAIRMTSTAKRIAVSIGGLPVVFGWFLISLAALENWVQPSDTVTLNLSMGAAAILAIIIWLATWRGVVVWTQRVWFYTLAMAIVLIGVPLGTEFLLKTNDYREASVYLYALAVVGWGVWMAGTIRLWPMRGLGDHETPRGPECPQCRYPLTGLNHTRCPECGHEPTLDALWASMTAEEP